MIAVIGQHASTPRDGSGVNPENPGRKTALQAHYTDEDG
jgi:hypothetical protein